MKSKELAAITFAVLLFSCSTKINDETYAKVQKRGSEMTTLTQSVLLSNVVQATQKGGTIYAVEFCNLEASSIVDSLNHANNCVISRISPKNRNQQNNLETDTDEKMWSLFSQGILNDTLVIENKNLTYYKPIKIMLPACLSCHGEPGVDIETGTHEKIQNLYPGDLATGYKLGDLRGLWKIEFKKNGF